MHPAAEFIVAWFGPRATGRIYIASLPNPELRGTPAGEPAERHILTRSSKQVADFTTKWDQPGRAVYWGPATLKPGATRRCKENIAELLGLHIDIDFKNIDATPEEIERTVKELPLPPTRLRNSGHGLQGFWGFENAIPGTPESIAEHERLQRLLADRLGGDRAACDACHLMRMPGTVNSKGGGSIPVRELVIDGPLYALDALRTWLEAAGEPLIRCKSDDKTGNGGSPDNPFLAFAATHAGEEPLDVDRMLAAMVYLGPGGGGNAHDTLLRCTAAMLTRGEHRNAVIERCLAALCLAAARPGTAFNEARERRAIEEMCDSWIAKHPEIKEATGEENKGSTGEENKGPQAFPRGWWHGDVDVELRRKYLVKKLIPETGTGLLPGQWGTYKTFVALDLAGAVMTGVTFAGHAVKRRGGILFIAVEGREEIPIRLEALNRAKCGKAERLPFFCLDEIPRLVEKEASNKIAATAKTVAAEMQQRFGLPLALIIIDTVAAGAGYAKAGDENDAAIAQRIMDTLARISKLTGAFVLAVDHFGKAVETGTRGSSAKESFADVVLALLGEKELSGGVKNPRMAARKRRGGPNGEELAFTAQLVAIGTDEDGDPIDTLVLEWGGEVEPPADDGEKDWAKASRDVRLLRRVMMDLFAEHATELRLAGVSIRALDQEIVRAEFYRNKAVDGSQQQQQAARQKAFRRAVDSARDRQLIGVRVIDEQTWLWLTTPHAENA
jgi:AAA domain/RepB DNA-primase from phage plasmid